MKISAFSRIDLRQLPLAILIFAVLNLTTCLGQGRGNAAAVYASLLCSI